MMVIPENLPLDIAPLAWFLGDWRGWGMRSVTDGDDTPVIEEVRARICGTQMRMTTTIYEATATRDMDPLWDAATGLSALERGDLLREETLYVRRLPGSGVLPPPGEYEPRELTASGAQNDGYAVLWVGRSVGPRMQMVSDAIATAAGAEEYSRFSRMYGLVAGELMWAQERSGNDGEDHVELSGRLMRVEDGAEHSSDTADEAQN